jgi:hypothetical protein
VGGENGGNVVSKQSLIISIGVVLLPGLGMAAASIELYGTMHAMGVIVSIGDTDDPDGDAVASVAFRKAGETFRDGFPLARVSDTRFVGSLFWLESGAAYEVSVSFSDPDGLLHGVTVAGISSTRAEISIPLAQSSLFVSPSGSGTACSPALPCSLAEGLGRAVAGDEVVLGGGVYHEGEFSLPHSGVAGAPIVIRAANGQTPILDGSDPAVFPWTHQGGGVYRTTVNASDPHLVVADGERLYPYQSQTDLQDLLWGIPGFFADGTSVWVRLENNADPNGADMLVSRFNHAFAVEYVDHIYFLDLTMRYFGCDSYAKAIYFNNASHNLVRGCTVFVCDTGIGIKRESHGNVIEDNDFSDTVFDWPWDAVKAGSGLESGGVVFYDPATGQGNIIRRNTFHDYFDGFSVCPSSTAALTNETDVYENQAYDIGDDAMETDGQCSNVRIWGNTFHDVLMGISLAPVYTGPVYAIRNLIYNTGVGNNSYSGSPFKFNSGFGRSGPMYLIHNTSDGALPDNNGLYIKSPGTWDLIWARNNIWAGTSYAICNSNTSQPVDLDYDDLFTTLAGELVWWAGLPDRHLNTLAELQAATGQELNGKNVEPGFFDTASGDYTLSPGSQLIDQGLVIPGINDDYSGSGPDIGAFEFGMPFFADGFETGQTSAWSSSVP